MTSIAFIVCIVLIWYVTDNMEETKEFYKTLISGETNEDIKNKMKEIYEISKKKNKKYLGIFIILLLISVAVSVMEIVSIFNK